MGNKSSTQDSIKSLDDSDFLQVENDEASNNPKDDDDMSSSGILVENPSSPTAVNPNRRRIIKGAAPKSSSSSTHTSTTKEEEEEDGDQPAKSFNNNSTSSEDTVTVISDSNDEELLQESIANSRQKRMQRLAADQKSKRESKQSAGRTHPNKIQASANPFSRFLSAFSVDTKYPHHKRAYEDQEDDLHDGPPPKHQKMNESGKDNDKSSSLGKTILAELWRESLPLVAAAAVASLAMLLVFRKKQP
jgi:hypothetical protein